MILLIDAGNSRIKWRMLEMPRQGILGQQYRCGVVPSSAAAELARAWQGCRCQSVVVSCVANDAVQSALAQAIAGVVLADEINVAVHWLRPEREKYGLINRYAAPEKLGADRYAALIAAARLRVGNCVVVSVGTATTIDALSLRDNQQSEFLGGEFMGGEFMGGVILPGPAMMRAALLQGTGQIERKMVTAVPPAQASSLAFSQDTFSQAIFPQDTAAAVESGIVLAQVGAVHAMRDRMTQADAAPPLVILTGGARGEIRDGLQAELIDIEDLVLEGLAWIALESEVASR